MLLLTNKLEIPSTLTVKKCMYTFIIFIRYEGFITHSQGTDKVNKTVDINHLCYTLVAEDRAVIHYYIMYILGWRLICNTQFFFLNILVFLTFICYWFRLLFSYCLVLISLLLFCCLALSLASPLYPEYPDYLHLCPTYSQSCVHFHN